MAENETLDLGHKSRWKQTRIALDDPNRSLFEVAQQASADFERMARLLPLALRKGPSLLVLLRAVQISTSETRAVVATFSEKRLAKLVVDAIRLSPAAEPAFVARSASQRMIEGLIDQVVARAASKQRFKGPSDHAELRAQLKNRFESHRAELTAHLESALRGDRPKVRRSVRTGSATAVELVSKSLIARRPGESHGR